MSNISFAGAAHGGAMMRNFLGDSPDWYKIAVVGFLVVNPLLFFAVGPFVAGWALLVEFIFTLAMALKCYPLGPGGLLAFEAVLIGMVSPDAVYAEVVHNIPVILLLVFMVAGVHFLQELLMFVFTRILLGVRSKTALALVFTAVAAFLSAFLDALTVTAVIIAVVGGLYAVYTRAISAGGLPSKTGESASTEQSERSDAPEIARPGVGLPATSKAGELSGADVVQFRAFLRNLMMHAVVGTALGGVTTLVGEPQNLLLGRAVGWHFGEFFVQVAPVSIPVVIAGLLTCILLERTRAFGYGVKLPESVRQVLEAHATEHAGERDAAGTARLIAQGCAVVLLIAALGWHVAEIGLLGLALLVLTTAFTGVVEEHRIGRAFTEALPFTALLVVFFAIIAVIDAHNLFLPIMNWVFGFTAPLRLGMVYLVNGVLSMISDNVFVATVYLNAVKAAIAAGTVSASELPHLVVAINTGTNIPSVATPNGQAAFLFLLTSALAPVIRLSYGRMVWMALPYTIVLSLTGFLAVLYLLGM